jgi:hypothetical protein
MQLIQLQIVDGGEKISDDPPFNEKHQGLSGKPQTCGDTILTVIPRPAGTVLPGAAP